MLSADERRLRNALSWKIGTRRSLGQSLSLQVPVTARAEFSFALRLPLETGFSVQMLLRPA